MVVDGVDLVVVMCMTMLVVSMDITRMDLTLMNVEPLAYENHHARAMLFQQILIPIPIDVMFMETFCRQRSFLDGMFYKHSILYQQNPVLLI